MRGPVRAAGSRLQAFPLAIRIKQKINHDLLTIDRVYSN
jgi:hypothetical protein